MPAAEPRKIENPSMSFAQKFAARRPRLTLPPEESNSIGKGVKIREITFGPPGSPDRCTGWPESSCRGRPLAGIRRSSTRNRREAPVDRSLQM